MRYRRLSQGRGCVPVGSVTGSGSSARCSVRRASRQVSNMVESTARPWPVVLAALGVSAAIAAVACVLIVASRAFSVGAAAALVVAVFTTTLVAAMPIFILALVPWRRPAALLIVIPLAWLLSGKAWFLLVDQIVLGVLQRTVANASYNYREAFYVLLTDEGAGMAVYGLALVMMTFVITSLRISKLPRVAAHAVTLVIALLFVISCCDAAGIA